MLASGPDRHCFAAASSASLTFFAAASRQPASCDRFRQDFGLAWRDGRLACRPRRRDEEKQNTANANALTRDVPYFALQELPPSVPAMFLAVFPTAAGGTRSVSFNATSVW